jgi:hypothetical protein
VPGSNELSLTMPMMWFSAQQIGIFEHCRQCYTRHIEGL